MNQLPQKKKGIQAEREGCREVDIELLRINSAQGRPLVEYLILSSELPA